MNRYLGHLGVALVMMLAVPALAHAQEPRPVVLIVHGRGQVGRDSAQLRRDAWHALQAGLHDAGASFSLEERDVRVVWYADLLDTHANAACPASATADARERDVVPSVASIIAMMAGPILDAASDNAQGDDAAQLRALAGDLRYLSSFDTRCAAQIRVRDALAQAHRENRPVILISHSLGALVTWEELSQAEQARDTTIGTVQEWITAGSPLGSAEVRQLVFGDDRSALVRPKSVRTWRNIMDSDDPLAMHIDDVTDPGVSQVTTESHHDDPHEIMSYLADKATARAVMAAWRSP